MYKIRFIFGICDKKIKNILLRNLYVTKRDISRADEQGKYILLSGWRDLSAANMITIAVYFIVIFCCI